jgi:hypothetical protein
MQMFKRMFVKNHDIDRLILSGGGLPEIAPLVGVSIGLALRDKLSMIS